MKKIILQQAFEELNDAIAYYEEQQTGLGLRLRLKEEFERHVSWILGNSDVPRVRGGGYHRVNLRTFPYYIAYIVRKNTLWIIAVAHGHRRPEYWIKRKNEII
ncbi:type II toxin-antitoxin system RelE/ParE family toxin [Desulfonema magnum]|uniref:Toxin-antitoxin system, toxin component, RelE/ParE-like n=1 Tax=Desulfonema magnum TaxID=45655 RepID=A0A975GS53_9BACT|nr:type II toxin-antitoxin system RelE/ParE family toxin [Desulfonema magnum]QTA91706.1 putative toxin-antitoxin system, toxin component, RelE/ParE-like [Desulfonema magnum]